MFSGWPPVTRANNLNNYPAELAGLTTRFERINGADRSDAGASGATNRGLAYGRRADFEVRSEDTT